MFAYFHKVFNTVTHQKKMNVDRQKQCADMLNDLHSASKGISSTSVSLYNFLKKDYVDFSLKELSHLVGVNLRSYSVNSTELVDFINDLLNSPNVVYLAKYKSIKDAFTLEDRHIGDWFDSDESIGAIMFSMERILEMYIFHHTDYYTGLKDDEFQAHFKRIQSMDRLNPGLYDFVQIKDFHSLVSEILNILIALYTINLRSLGETTES